MLTKMRNVNLYSKNIKYMSNINVVTSLCLAGAERVSKPVACLT